LRFVVDTGVTSLEPPETPMLRQTLTLVAAALGIAAALPAHAVGNLVDVQIIDRGTSQVLAPILHQGEWWIVGRPGARYAVTLLNRYGTRTLNVLSVDGVNAISGDTAAWNQTGYVLDPYRRAEITGWRKNMEQVAAFEFTALPDSYAARTGRPANVGVIGVAIFNERQQPMPPAQVGRDAQPESYDSAARPAPRARMETEAAAPANAASNATGKLDASRLASDQADRARIGTGHGATEQSAITNVAFERMQPSPNEVVTIHYDRRENLIAMGIIPQPVLPPIAADPFPKNNGFVQDPPPRRRGWGSWP
jgi:hypothetical protein